MARALVVFESVPGETRLIAMAVAQGLATRLPVDVACAQDAPIAVPGDVRLLVVGAPGHPPAEPAAPRYGLREWLEAVTLPRGLQVAAFDLRPDEPARFAADGAMGIERALIRGLGASPAAPPEHFLLTDAQGPLADGQDDRARRWGQALAEVVAPRPVFSAARAATAG